MKVWLEHDETHDVWTIKHEDCRLECTEAVNRWQSQLIDALALKGAAKVDLMVDMAGMLVEGAVADEYGAVAKLIVGEHARCLMRYGHPEGMTAANVRLQAAIQRFPANIFEDRAAALAALQKMRESDAA